MARSIIEALEIDRATDPTGTIDRILKVMSRSGHDFTLYKQSMLAPTEN